MQCYKEKEKEAMRPFGGVAQNCFVNRFKSLPIYLFLKGDKSVPLPPILTWEIVTYIKFPLTFKNGYSH